MLTIRDHNKNEYPLLAVKTVTEDLNGNPVLELKIPKQNNLDLKLIDKLWEINYQTVDYKIMYVKQITKGDSFYLDVRAIPLFYWDFDKQIVHESKDGHYTGVNAFTDLFNGTGYQYVLVDFVEAIQIEGYGKGETRLEMFKRLIERFGLEFYIVGKTIYLRKLIGNDTNFQYRYKLNASNVSKSIDASNYFTHIKGFGNFEEGSDNYFKDAKLKREYTSPLASVLGKYEGKPIVDGRIKDTATMDANLKKAVEESLEISIEGNLHDVRSIYAEAVPTIGDRVFLIDERIGLEQEIRIHTLKRTYDINDKLIDCEVTFGSQNIRDRYKSNLNSAAKNFTALMKGDIKLPTWSLDEIARGMITKIHASENELRYGDFGIQAIDKNNPNNVFGLNSQGWYISTDGGRTARTIATAEGIVADAITTGTLRAITVEGVEIYGSYIESRKDKDEYVYINSGAVMSHGKFTRTWAGETDTANLEMGLYNGQLRVRNKDNGYRLYLTERGLSTSMEGAIDQLTSGTLEFHSQRFNAVSRGITMHSSYGTVALVSDYSTAVIRSNLTANIESEEYSVYLRPQKNSRNGLNEFAFYIKANESTQETDGTLLFGDLTGENSSGSGLRFSKRRNLNTVYVTNINGDIGTGDISVRDAEIRGSIRTIGRLDVKTWDGTGYNQIGIGAVNTYNSLVFASHSGGHSYFGVASNEMRVTNNNGYNGGSTTYRDIRYMNAQLVGHIAHHGTGGWFYIGAGGTNGVRFTNNNWADGGYKNIQYKEAYAHSSELAKYDKEDWNFNVLDRFRNELQLSRFRFNNDENKLLHHGIIVHVDPRKDTFPIEWRRGDSYSTNEVLWWTVKGVQELAHENDSLKQRLDKLEEQLNATK